MSLMLAVLASLLQPPAAPTAAALCDALERKQDRAPIEFHDHAAFVLGQIYWNGDGVGRNRSEAARWWRLAHERGRPDAAHLLAREALARFTSGGRDNLDPRVAEEALGWFTLAAERDPSPVDRQDAVEKSAMLRQFIAAVRQREGR